MTALGVVAIPAADHRRILIRSLAPEAAFVVAAVCTIIAIPLVLLKLRLPETPAGGEVLAELRIDEEIAPVV